MVFSRIPPVYCRLQLPINTFVPCRGFQRTSRTEDYKKYYRTLGIEDGSDQEDVRRAFVNLVKRYHPDSDSPEASAAKFQEVEHAYRMLQNKFAHERHNRNCDGEYGLYYNEKKGKQNNEVKEFDIKHTAPQHRQYLSYEGQGVGTPSERQKQYQKLRAATAVENVYNHRITKLQSGGEASQEDSLIVKDKKKSKDIKTRYGMERLVEDLIQESMARGDFDNLSGSGKPLKQYNEYNPYVDFMTHKMNQIMIDNGFMPAWITLQKEISEERDFIRSTLAKERAKLGPLPLPAEDEIKWAESVDKVRENVAMVNKKVEKFNLVVPMLRKQMLQFNLDGESEKILAEGKSKDSLDPEEQVVEEKNKKSTLSALLNSVIEKVYR